MNKKNTTENEPQIPKENEGTKETKENPQDLEENEQNLPEPPVTQWSKEKVGEWIEKLLGGENGTLLKNLFIEQEISGDALFTITENQLEKLGIKLGPRNLIIQAISKLKEGIFNQLKEGILILNNF